MPFTLTGILCPTGHRHSLKTQRTGHPHVALDGRQQAGVEVVVAPAQVDLLWSQRVVTAEAMHWRPCSEKRQEGDEEHENERQPSAPIRSQAQ